MSINGKLANVDILIQNQKFKAASKICKKILIKKPNCFSAQEMFARCYLYMQQFNKAIVEFKKAILLNDQSAMTYYYLGVAYGSTQQFVKAEEMYHKTLSITPNFSDAFNNLGNCQHKSQKYSDAEVSFMKAIRHNDNKVIYKVNLGATLLAQGKLDGALDSLIAALVLDNTQSDTYIQIIYIFMYLHRYQDAIEAADIGIMSQQLSEMQLCEILIAKAIIFWQFGNTEQAKKVLDLSISVLSHQDSHSKIHMLRVFHRYIGELIKYSQLNASLYEMKSPEKIYFVSESHGFAPNGMSIQYQEQDYTVYSRFIIGAKVFHFSQDMPNKFQTSLVTLLTGIPVESKVVLGFGEIDCRYNEGILPYCLKNKKNIEQVIQKTLDLYINALESLNRKFNHDIILYGVPAPHSYFIDKLDTVDQADFKLLIAKFNQYLAKRCVDSNFKFLDVYKLTNKNGESNLKYHIDATHVKPITVVKLFEMLN